MKQLNLRYAVVTFVFFLLSASVNAQTISTFVSSGISYPSGLAFDTAGNLFVGNGGNNSISKITPNGTVSTFNSSGLYSPTGIAFDTVGNLFVTNEFGGYISKITPNGVISTIVSGLRFPRGIAIDRTGNLFVSCNTKIIKITTDSVVTTFDSSISYPYGLVFDKSGNLFVAGNNSIDKVTKDGVVSTFASCSSKFIDFDKFGNLYGTRDTFFIDKISPDGIVSNFIDSRFLNYPNGLAFDKAGNLYVASSVNSTIYKITFDNLPVTISSFTATTNNNTIETNWHTSTELNTSHFIIQHSTDGSSFAEIGTVKAVGSGANSYSFTDTHPTPSPLNGVVYYRLQSVDKDGSSTFSKVVSVQLTVDRLPFTVVPNPARDFVTVKGNHIASVQVIDNIGRVVKVVTLKDATNPVLSVSSLPTGVYHLRIETMDGKVKGVGFVKE